MTERDWALVGLLVGCLVAISVAHWLLRWKGVDVKDVAGVRRLASLIGLSLALWAALLLWAIS